MKKKQVAPITPLPKTILTEREKEVLRCICEGYSNDEIAEQLFISLNTAKTHLKSIYSKLGVSRRSQAILCVTKHPYLINSIQNHSKG